MGNEMIRGLAFVVTLCLSAAAVQGQTEWTSPGPAGGGTGGLIVVHPTGTLVLLQDGKVYQSRDGRTWTRVGVGVGTSWVESLIATPDGILYAGTHDGVLRSDDVGRWWRKVNNTLLPPYNAPVVALTTEGSGGLLAGVNTPVLRQLSIGGVWRSDDGGVTWRLASTGLPIAAGGRPIAITQLHVTGERVAFATTYMGELFRSVDGGTTAGDTSTSPRTTPSTSLAMAEPRGARPTWRTWGA